MPSLRGEEISLATGASATGRLDERRVTARRRSALAARDWRRKLARDSSCALSLRPLDTQLSAGHSVLRSELRVLRLHRYQMLFTGSRGLRAVASRRAYAHATPSRRACTRGLSTHDDAPDDAPPRTSRDDAAPPRARLLLATTDAAPRSSWMKAGIGAGWLTALAGGGILAHTHAGEIVAALGVFASSPDLRARRAENVPSVLALRRPREDSSWRRDVPSWRRDVLERTRSAQVRLGARRHWPVRRVRRGRDVAAREEAPGSDPRADRRREEAAVAARAAPRRRRARRGAGRGVHVHVTERRRAASEVEDGPRRAGLGQSRRAARGDADEIEESRGRRFKVEEGPREGSAGPARDVCRGAARRGRRRGRFNGGAAAARLRRRTARSSKDGSRRRRGRDAGSSGESDDAKEAATRERPGERQHVKGGRRRRWPTSTRRARTSGRAARWLD